MRQQSWFKCYLQSARFLPRREQPVPLTYWISCVVGRVGDSHPWQDHLLSLRRCPCSQLHSVHSSVLDVSQICDHAPRAEIISICAALQAAVLALARLCPNSNFTTESFLPLLTTSQVRAQTRSVSWTIFYPPRKLSTTLATLYAVCETAVTARKQVFSQGDLFRSSEFPAPDLTRTDATILR